MMKSRLIVIILGVAVASSFVAIYSAMSSTSLDESSDSEAEVIEGSYQGHRRSLLMKKWKARKMCPPGLDICRDEEKRKAEEIAERRNAKEEREKEEAKELEELSDKTKAERDAKKAEKEALMVEKELAREAEIKAKQEEENQKVKKAKGLFKGFMKVRKREAPSAEDLRLLNLELKYRDKAEKTPFGGNKGSADTAADEVIDEATNEPKGWKNKRKKAVRVSFDSAGAIPPEPAESSAAPASPAAPPAAAEELTTSSGGVVLPVVPTHWGSGKPVDDTSILAIGRAAEAASRKLKKGKGKHGAAVSDASELTAPDRPNAMHGGVRAGARPKSAEELLKEGLAAGRRILIYAPASSGGSLLAYMLAQLPASVAILNLRNSQLPPTPEELSDVPSESTVIVKASSDSDFSLFDHVKAFRPHIKVLVVRHPAHIRAGLLRARLDMYKEMPGPDVVLQRLEEAFKGSDKRFDAVFLYEELVWNKVLTSEKLRTIGFSEAQVLKMNTFPRPVTAVVAWSQQKSKWIMTHKQVGWDAGNVKKLGSGEKTMQASFIDRKPTLEDRGKAIAKAPLLTKHYRTFYPELDAEEGVGEWVKTVQLLMKAVAKRKDPTTNTVILTVADHRWQDLVVNWMAALHRLGLAHYLVVAADAQLHDALHRIGAPSFYHSVFFNPYGSQHAGWDGKEKSEGEVGARAERYRGAMWSYKWQLVGAVLKRGVHVVCMDADAIPVRDFTPLIQGHQGSQLVVGRGSKLAQDVIGGGFTFLRSSPELLTFLPKFIALAQKVLDDQRALNLVLNTGFVKWARPVLDDSASEAIGGLAKSGLKVTLLPNLQVRAHCDSAEYPAQTSHVVHCKIPRTTKPDQRLELLTKYGVWLLRENFQFVEFPGNFEAWLDVIIDTRSLAYTVMTSQKKNLFLLGRKSPATMVDMNRSPSLPIRPSSAASVRMDRGIGFG